jgi:hypothetical protein
MGFWDGLLFRSGMSNIGGGASGGSGCFFMGRGGRSGERLQI